MIIDCIQGTPEWLSARCGKVTGSRVVDAIAELKRKDGEAAARKNYRADIVAEILTGRITDNFISLPMQWGMEQEQFAAAAYEMKRDCLLQPVGFAIHDAMPRFGASPDRLADDDGLIEFKCPNTVTHLDYLINGVVPDEYRPQMMAEMACTGRKWVDFVSFDPRLPEYLQLFIVRLQRNEEEISILESKVQKFLDEVDIMLGQLAVMGSGLDLTGILHASVRQVNEVAAFGGIVP